MPQADGNDPQEAQSLDLAHAARQLLDECRMVLPGIQALFGFQLIAVFNSRFEALDHSQQMLHLGAIVLIVISMALVMSPAAIHRHAESRRVTRSFINLGSRLLLGAMLTLAVGVCADVYLVAAMIWSRTAAKTAALLLFAAFIALWIVMPIVYRKRHHPGRQIR